VIGYDLPCSTSIPGVNQSLASMADCIVTSTAAVCVSTPHLLCGGIFTLPLSQQYVAMLSLPTPLFEGESALLVLVGLRQCVGHKPGACIVQPRHVYDGELHARLVWLLSRGLRELYSFPHQTQHRMAML
jgi:hypothetical protein